MDEDDRNRLAGEGGEQDEGGTLAFSDPRDADRMGRHYATPANETAEPEARDGQAANLDDDAHERAVSRSRAKPKK
jgi:hypothetical protein